MVTFILTLVNNQEVSFWSIDLAYHRLSLAVNVAVSGLLILSSGLAAVFLNVDLLGFDLYVHNNVSQQSRAQF